MRLLHHLFLKGNVLDFVAGVHVFLHVFLTLLLEKILILRRVNLTQILVFSKTALFPFVEAHVILVSEMVEYSLGLEIDFSWLLFLNYLLDLRNELSIFLAVEDVSVIGFVLQRVEVNLLWHFFVNSLNGNTVFEDLSEIHVIIRQKFHAFPFWQEYFVEITFVVCCDIEIVCFGEVLSSFVVE
jgi:hypothetical protein